MAVEGSLAAALTHSLRGGWRLFTLRPGKRSDFAPSPELFALLVALDVVLLFVFAVAAVGLEGELNVYELPRTLLFVPLVLALALAAVRFDRGSDLLTLPVALASAGLFFTVLSSGLYLLAQRQWLPFTEMYLAFFDYVAISWAAVVVVLAVSSLTSAALWARGVLAAAGIVLLVLPSLWLPLGLIWMPRYGGQASYATGTFHSLAAESSFYAQHGALERELANLQPERPGIPDLYVVAAGLYAGEDVFMKEVAMIASLFRDRFDADGRIVRLVNNPKTIGDYPVASITSLRAALVEVGRTMNVDEDVLMLYVTSHGSENHELAVDFRPLRLDSITPDTLKSALDDSGVRWKVVVVSACYSGGFIDTLKDERTMIVTAASADRQSFGCGYASDATYLGRALFGEALRNTFSFEAAAKTAFEMIGKWEREKNQKASQPQIHVGAEIRVKLAEVERRLTARAARAK